MNTLRRHLPGTALAFGLLLCGLSQGRAQTKNEPTETKTVTTEPKAYTFEMRGKPWPAVFEWLTDKTGRDFISSNAPSGTFNVITQKGRKYTIPQIIDIINDGLLKEKWVLLNRGTSFTLVPADEKIDPALVPRISVSELGDHGNTEIVSLVYQCKSLVAEDSAPEVKKQMGPFNEVVPLRKSNQLLLQDTVGNLKRVIKELDDQERKEASGAQAETYYHKCIYIRASKAEAILRSFLGEQKQIIETVARGNNGQNGAGGGGNPAGPGGGRGGPGGGFGPGGGGGGQPNYREEQPRQATTQRVRAYTVTSDEGTNSVLVNGPPDKIAQADAVMKKIDVGTVPYKVGVPVLQTYFIKEGNAPDVAKTLTEIHKGNAAIKIASIGNTQLMVLAAPEDQLDIANQINGIRPASGKTELIRLNVLDASKAVVTLQGLFPDSKNVGASLYLEPDASQNAIIVKGTPDQLVEVKTALAAIGENPGTQSGGMRIISLEKGSAATVAEAIQRMLSEMRANPVRVIVPGGGRVPSLDNLKQEAPKLEKAPQPKSNNDSCDEQAQLVDPAPKAKEPAKDKGGAPVTITVLSNKLIVTSDDPEALKLVSELVRLLTTNSTAPGDFEIIRLKHANAVDAAKILDEAFNGAKPAATPGFGGFGGGGKGGKGGFGGGGFPGGNAATAARVDRIRVVADPATNALLVQASPLDMLTIRNLLSKQLDAGFTDSNAVIKTQPPIGPLKNLHATDVYYMLRDLYRESMDNNPRGRAAGGGGGLAGLINGPRVQSLNLDANGNPKGVTLTLAVDDKTNTLLVACPTPMYDDIKKLVEQMEIAAGDFKQTVKFVRLPGVDPAVIQQALDAIQGRVTVNRNTTGTNAMPGNFGGGFPGFGGNRGPGGGGFGGFGGFGGGGAGFGNPTFTPIGVGGRGPGGGGPGGGGGRGPGAGGGGGGGGRGPGGAGGRGPGGQQSRGPDFFEYRVKDDPQPILFDPRLEAATTKLTNGALSFISADVNPSTGGYQPIQLVAQVDKAPPAGKSPEFIAPRLPVTVEALDTLGGVVIRSSNPADMAAVEAIIKYVLEEAAKTEIEINLIPLKNADATSVVNMLNQLYARVVVGPYSNTQIQVPRTQGAQPGGFPGGGFPGGGFGQQNQAQAGAVATSLVLIPIVRENAILLAAPKSRVETIKAEIARLDIVPSEDGKAVAFPLKRAAAKRVGPLISQFYSFRYANETVQQNQIRVTWDDGTNTVFVQAAPADLAEIRSLIEHIDGMGSSAVNDLRIVPLKNAVAQDLAAILAHTVSDNFTQGSGATTAGGVGAIGGAGAFGAGGGALGAGGALGGAIGGATQPGGIQPTVPAQTKVKALRLITQKDGKFVESSIFEDVRITSDPRTNTLIIDAPPRTMELILALIRQLDVPPTALALVNVFTLKRADAVQTAITLQKLFLNVGGLGSTTTTGGGGGGGAAGATLGGTGAAGGTGGATLGSPQPLQFSISGISPQGAPLIDLRIAVDERTNSIIAAGSRNDLDVIEAIIAKLETAVDRARRREAIKLHNALAADVAAALNDFLPKSLKIYTTSGQLSGNQELLRDVAITAEPISNSLLIDASPEYFDMILRLIADLDVMPPQVMIQVLVAEVDVTNSDEFGVEIGLQSPVIFNRGLSVGSDNVTLSNAITSTTNPGFLFNNVNLPIGNTSVVNPGVVGYQGLNNLGVGTVSPTNGVGGFVFSAASNSFNLLVRALAVQSRLDILSRPQLMTLDNQTSLINVGKEIPIVTGTTVTATGLVTQNIDRRQVGVILQVTPKIGPDGQILMRIIPEISSVDPVPVNLGNGNISTSLEIQHLETTVTANDGETIVLGGLLSKSNTKTENKIPWLGDLPGVGALFRYRTMNKLKKELLIIMTPHVVRCRADADRIMAEEARKMDWVLGDALRMQGPFIDPLSMGAFPKCDVVTPIFPKTTGQTIEQMPVPVPVPNPPQTLPPGQSSQAPVWRQQPGIQQPVMQQPVMQSQPMGANPAYAPNQGPVLAPQAYPATSMVNPAQVQQVNYQQAAVMQAPVQQTYVQGPPIGPAVAGLQVPTQGMQQTAANPGPPPQPQVGGNVPADVNNRPPQLVPATFYQSPR